MDGFSDTATIARTDDPKVTANVWLFGSLSALTPERPVALHLPAGFTAGDVIDAMGARIGPRFVERVLAAPGEKFSHCRIFADGRPVEDLNAPLTTGGPATEIEMILLIAAEGG